MIQTASPPTALTLPFKTGDFGRSRLAARPLGYIGRSVGRKGGRVYPGIRKIFAGSKASTSRFPSAGHVEKSGAQYRLVPIFWNPVI